MMGCLLLDNPEKRQNSIGECVSVNQVLGGAFFIVALCNRGRLLDGRTTTSEKHSQCVGVVSFPRVCSTSRAECVCLFCLMVSSGAEHSFLYFPYSAGRLGMLANSTNLGKC